MLNYLKKNKKFIALGLVIITGMLGVYFYQQYTHRTFKPDYAQTYRLVPEKISQSAAIRISLPDNIEQTYAQHNIEFYPEIEGEWITNTEEEKTVFAQVWAQGSKAVLFQPKEKLTLNRHWAVKLYMPDGGLMQDDFLTVENPEIIAIFPNKNTEAPENSEITIVFNRPMVPLTTLAELEDKDIPVEITPQTEGRYKWITTRNLQFIPEERLVRSSNYTVKIKEGLVSMDGLNVEPTESKFMTRKLRYLNLSKGQTVYNQPISIYFNQPVDLEKIKKEISLTDAKTGKKIPFIAEYESKSSNSYNRKGGSSTFGNVQSLVGGIADTFGLSWPSSKDQVAEDANRSIIRIYNKKDRFGREKLWDFKNNYSLKINKAYPAEGDINLDESRSTNINVPDIIKNISAGSDRTNHAAPEFFDPQGKLWVTFYEDINLSKSKIQAQKMQNIGYGEKCKDTGQKISQGIECEKIADKQKIWLTFREQNIGRSEKLEIRFDRIVNTEGLNINKEPIIKYLTSYPEFKILSTFPGDNAAAASLTEFIFCSNSPLAVPAAEDYGKHIKSNLDYEMNRWGSSRKITRYYQHEKCQVGEFHTSISYGLMPLADYRLEFKVEDAFGQKLSSSARFTTDKMSSSYLDFYHLQRSYSVTSPDKTRLTYATRNINYLNLEICQLEASDFFRYLEEKPRYYHSPGTITNCQKIVKDRIELPERYWIKNYFKTDIKNYFEDPIGHYIVTFHHPNYIMRWGEKKQIYERSYLTVTNLAVAEKRIQTQYASYGTNEPLSSKQLASLNNLYWVTDLSSMQPISDAKVTLYQKDKTGKILLAGSYNTNQQGIAETKIVHNLRGAIISKGKDSTIIPSSDSRLNYAREAFSANKIYLYTDKQIYQPGQKVSIKGIHRIGYDGNYEIPSNTKIGLKIFNSKYDEILSKQLKTNEFGTFNTEILLDKETPLGMYRVCAEKYSCAYFDVQEYVPAPFEVKVNTDKEEYISQDTAKLEIDANYYFGVPLEGGTVSYTISSQDYHFDRYSDGYFSFGSRWYYWPPYSYGEKFILRGETTLDDQGKAEISQLFDLEKLFKNKEDRKSKIIIVDVTVKNPQGQSISAQRSFIVHAGQFYLGLKADKSFLAKNETGKLKIKSVDVQGQETKIRDITLDIHKTSWIHSKRQGTDGGYQYIWEKKKELVKTYNFNTDNRGNFSQEISIAEEGSYQAEVWSRDKKNNLVWSTYNLYVYGEKEVSIRPTKDTVLEIEVEKTNLNVGETAEIIIKSPYPRAKALISIERGDVYEYEIKEIRGNLYKYSFEIKEEYAPNVYVSVLLQSGEPEIKFGKVEFKINTDRKELNIEVNSNKKHYLPGEEVILDISAKDHQGKPVLAEFSVAVVDLSVLALKGNPKKNPLMFFYGGFPLTVSTASNIKNILVEPLIITKGGGGVMASAEADNASAKKKRGVFKETAVWQAVVRTNESGQAQVKFILPDNLTTWQAETIGITKDTKLGVNYQEFIARKELMVVPLKPRFTVPGDTFYIGAKIFNQSEAKQKLSVTFDSQTLILEDDQALKKITIGTDKTDTVYFKVQASTQLEKGQHKFTLSAKAKDLEDTVEQSINVTENDTYEATATAHYTSDPISREYVFLPNNIIKNKGDLSIKASATLAVFLSDGLNYLMGYPYGCSEQIASKLNAIAIVQRGLDLPNIGDKLKLEKIKYKDQEYSLEEAVEIGLAKLYNNQQGDGGFSYWKHGRSNFYVTLHVAETLNNLSLAGFEINQSSLDRAGNYLYKEITRNRNLYQSKNNVILAAYTLSQLPGQRNLNEKIIEIVNDDLFINEQISNTSLAYLAILLTEDEFNQSLKNKVFATLENRINIDSRGAFLEINKNRLWHYYETPIKNTALFLKALAKDERDIKILDKVTRWLLNSRQKDGSWGSTNNTLTAIDAFTDFLQWRRETESDFTLELVVNDSSENSFRFDSETILDQFGKKIPLQDLKFNENNIIEFSKTNHNELANNLYYDISLKYYLPADKIPPRDEGFSIIKEFYKLDDKKNENPVREARVGDVLRGHLQITVPESRNFVMVEDYIPAGMEIVNTALATEEKSLRLQEKELAGREFRPDFKEIHNDRLFLYKERLRPGVYEFDYYTRVLIKGDFIHLPATVGEMYFPENFGRSAGTYFKVK